MFCAEDALSGVCENAGQRKTLGHLHHPSETQVNLHSQLLFFPVRHWGVLLEGENVYLWFEMKTDSILYYFYFYLYLLNLVYILALIVLPITKNPGFRVQKT